jgi:protein subunit release factor B
MEFGISEAKHAQLREKMQRLGIREQDLQEKFVRSGGKGGQNVNKTATCVYLKHIPTGIEVKCQQERYQGLNRFLARRILANKLETIILGKLSQERKRIAKIRKQKRRRSKRAKEKMLRAKRERSEKKQTRSYRPMIDE